MTITPVLESGTGNATEMVQQQQTPVNASQPHSGHVHAAQAQAGHDEASQVQRGYAQAVHDNFEYRISLDNVLP